MPRPWIWLLVAALLAGCLSDKLAGTETGNPEIAVSARFGIVKSDSSASIPAMNLKVMGVNYRTLADSTGTLWDEPQGTMVDFASESDSLPAVMVRGAWTRAELMLVAPAGDDTLPDTGTYLGSSNPRYMKLIKMAAGDTTRFLIELPQDISIKLMYDRITLDSWQKDGRMTLVIMFDCAKLAGAVSGPFQSRKDAAGSEYIVLSPRENAVAYARLRSLLPECFMADAVEIL